MPNHSMQDWLAACMVGVVRQVRSVSDETLRTCCLLDYGTERSKGTDGALSFPVLVLR